MSVKKRKKGISRRDFLKATGAAGLAGVLGACAPAATPTPTPTTPPEATPAPPTPTAVPTPTPVLGAPKRGGVLIDARAFDILDLDPQTNLTTQAGQKLTPMMYDNLVTTGPKNELIPQLAESWEMTDERTWVFHLRKGVKFHNGRELTAEDVKYSYERTMDPEVGAQGSRYLTDVESVEIVDKETIAIKLKGTNAIFPNLQLWCYIIPQEVQDQPKDFLKSNVVGTGPFMLEEWKPEISTKLVRNPDYWKPGLPYLDGITIPITPEEATAVAGLRTGVVDLVTLEDPNNFELLKRVPTLDLAMTPSCGSIFMPFKGDRPPMDDLKVRQALSQALDREEFLRLAGSGLGSVSGCIPPSFVDVWVPPEELPFYDYNPEKAKELLKESSVPDGFKMDALFLTTIPIMKNSAELCKKYWEEIGIEVELRGMESTVWVDTVVTTGDFYFTTNLDVSGPSPESILMGFMCGAVLDNFYHTCQPDIDAMLQKVLATTDPEERRALWRDIQILEAELVPTLWTYASTVVVAKQRWVKDFTPWPDKRHRGWEYVWLDKA